MTQIATVLSVPGPGRAVVTVARSSACGHDCGSCGGCGASPGSVTVSAETDVSVSPGDRVEIESRSVLAYAALVYLLPPALFLALCALPLPTAGRYLCGIAGFVLGVALAVLCGRLAVKRRPVRYRIARKL